MTDRDKETPGQIDPHEANDDRMGEGTVRDLGVPGELREEMFENARLLNDFQRENVNDEPSFNDGLPGDIADFDLVQARDDAAGASGPRSADPNNDAGGEVHGPRVGGSGVVDGGPPRTRPLPGQDDAEE